jgi:hypothetical protein
LRAVVGSFGQKNVEREKPRVAFLELLRGFSGGFLAFFGFVWNSWREKELQHKSWAMDAQI